MTTEEEHLIDQVLTDLQPDLIELVERYPEEERELVLMAIASFGVYFLGRFAGNDAARDFSQLMLDRVDSINPTVINVKKYDA